MAPTVVVIAPAQDIEIGLSVGGTVSITYADSDVDGEVTTDIVADVDGDPATTADQVVIAAGRPARDGAPQTVSWDVAGVAPGTYRILALTSDAATTVVAQAPGMVLLNAPPTLQITQPANDVVISRGAMLDVEVCYVADDPDDTAATWLFADEDEDLLTLDGATLIAAVLPEMDGLEQTCRWNPGLPPGDYSIVGQTWDGTNPPVSAIAPGRLRVVNVAWAKRAGGADYDEGIGIAALADGSCVVTGQFRETATFGPGEAGETVLTSAGLAEIFVARHNADGTLAWAKRAGGGGDYDYGISIAALADGSCVVTGSFGETATFGPGEAGETVLTSAGWADIFVARYNADGTLAWAKRAGSTDFDNGSGIAALADGSCVVTGLFGATATFGPGEAGETVLTSAGGFDIFVARYNADGTLAWAKRAGGADYDEGVGIAALADGSCVVTGPFRAAATFGPGEAGETDLSSAGGRATTRTGRWPGPSAPGAPTSSMESASPPWPTSPASSRAYSEQPPPSGRGRRARPS
ncbi:MAG: hypothetical protein ACYTG3_12685 [Planctomycetota bacterium]